MALHSLEPSCSGVEKLRRGDESCGLVSFQMASERGVLSCKVVAAITAARTLNIKTLSEFTCKWEWTFHNFLSQFVCSFSFCCCPLPSRLFPPHPLPFFRPLSSLSSQSDAYRGELLARRYTHTHNQPLCASSQVCFIQFSFVTTSRFAGILLVFFFFFAAVCLSFF